MQLTLFIFISNIPSAFTYVHSPEFPENEFANPQLVMKLISADICQFPTPQLAWHNVDQQQGLQDYIEKHIQLSLW